MTAFVRASSDPDVVRALAVPVVPGDLADVDALARALAPVDALLCVASLGFGHAPGIVAAVGRAGGSAAASTSARRPSARRSRRRARPCGSRPSGVVLEGDDPATLLRPTMVYGAPGDRNLERLLRFVRRSPVVPVPGGGRGLHAAGPRRRPRGRARRRAAARRPGGPRLRRPGSDALDLFASWCAPSRACSTAAASSRACPASSGASSPRGEQLLRLDEDKSADPRPAADAFGFASRPLEDGLRAEARALGLLSGASA